MRKLLTIGAVVMLAACVANARWIQFDAAIGTNATATASDTQVVFGEVDAVYIGAPSKAAVTGAVSFVAQPRVSSALPSATMYTNASYSAAVTAQPRVLPTDNTGSSLTSLAIREPYSLKGDYVTFAITQSTAVTGVAVRAWLKMRD